MVVTIFRAGVYGVIRIGSSQNAAGHFSVQRYTPGSMEIAFPASDSCARRIQTDDILRVEGVDGAEYIVERIEHTVGTTARTTVTGRELWALMDRRQITPDERATYGMPTGFDSVAGSTETVMKHYMDRHMVSTYNPARTIPRVAIAADAGRGTADDAYHARYQNLMETVAEIGKAAGLSPVARVDEWRADIVFDVAEQVDRTVDQTANKPLIFRMGDGVTAALSTALDVQSAANVFYCSRAGDSSAWETLTQTYYSTRQEPRGMSRREVAASISVGDGANQYAELRENAQKLMPDYAERREATATPTGALRAGADYRIGDIASIVDPVTGDVINSEIIAINWDESEAARRCTVDFGKKRLSRFAAIARKMRAEG